MTMFRYLVLNAKYNPNKSHSNVYFLHSQELDLEQKIDLEIKMREGSAKLLAACNNPKASGYSGNY